MKIGIDSERKQSHFFQSSKSANMLAIHTWLANPPISSPCPYFSPSSQPYQCNTIPTMSRSACHSSGKKKLAMYGNNSVPKIVMSITSKTSIIRP